MGFMTERREQRLLARAQREAEVIAAYHRGEYTGVLMQQPTWALVAIARDLQQQER